MTTKFKATSWAFSTIIGCGIGLGLVWAMVAAGDWVNERFGPDWALAAFIGCFLAVLLGAALIYDVMSSKDADA